METHRENEFVDADLSDFPGLLAVSHLAQMVTEVPWFNALGDEFDEREVNVADDYLNVLGFPEAQLAQIANWEEADHAARSHNINSTWWEVEEQLRANLAAQACMKVDENVVMIALTHVSNAVGETVSAAALSAAARTGVADDGLVRLAVGAGMQVCNQAALVLAAEFDDEEDQTNHPFALKYRLFELGRWPIGIVGSSFFVF